MRALGVDAGSVVGFALLDVAPNGTAQLVEAGSFRPAEVELRTLMLHVSDGNLVVVEIPRGHLYKGHDHATKHLAAAAEVGGEIVGMMRAHGFQVMTCTAAQWRKGICRRASATDATVKTEIRMRVANWPALSNSHERDAAGAAIWAAMTVSAAALMAEVRKTREVTPRAATGRARTR